MLSRDELVAAVEAGERVEFFFFWGHTPGEAPVGKWCLSQWWPAEFTVDGVRYRSAEQFMMAEKARLFGDPEAERLILAAETPAEAKKLGRGVRDFDQDTWVARRFDIVVRGNEAKFGQDGRLREFLLSTGDQVLVEAAPRDVIWGIGLGASNPRAADPAAWRGRNLLGFALMAVRDALRD
nr:NADAR family protein [Amycolatopsis sp. YIM 10]